MKFLFGILFLLPLFSVAQQNSKAETQALRQELKEVLTNKTIKQVLVDTVIPDKETAIAVAEQILFRIYGKDQIIGEKPYTVKLVDGYWFLSGSLPKGWVGGVFSIIISAKDGRVIRLMHGK